MRIGDGLSPSGELAVRPGSVKGRNAPFDGLLEVGERLEVNRPLRRRTSARQLGLRMVTLEAVPADFRAQFESEAIEFLQNELDKSMPERKLKIVRDVNGWKIVGDLSLGMA